MCYDLALYLMNSNPEPDFPVNIKLLSSNMCGKFLKVTAHQPQILLSTLFDLSMLGTPLPEGLHLSCARCFEAVDSDISGAYSLGISSPMELNHGQ